nr:extracellular solute-binding protein [Clostridia bacterium]
MNHTLCRLISAVLLSATVLSLAACASDNGTNAQTTADTTVSASAETTEETTTAAETKPAVQVPDLPSKDWEGRSAMFLVKGPGQGNWESKEIWVPEENGEVVNDAVYARNLKMEERYNFKVAITGGDSLDSMARTVILAGDSDYDVVMPNMTQSANLANEKLTFDLYDVPYIDLDRDYYDQNSISDLTIGGKLYFVTGEIAYQDQDGIWVTMFNKELAESYGIDDPYKLVRDGTWTVDRLIEMTSDVSRDIDGDGKMGITDMWGFVSAYSTV